MGNGEFVGRMLNLIRKIVQEPRKPRALSYPHVAERRDLPVFFAYSNHSKQSEPSHAHLFCQLLQQGILAPIAVDLYFVERIAPLLRGATRSSACKPTER